MKWWPGEPAPGDMIRVRLGSVYHYGVFVSEDEVIQFGPPPVDTLARDPAAVTVCAATAEEFACGRIIEIAQPDRAEARRRRTPDEAVSAARARLGEGGYDLLRNNCEHFAYECVFGEHYCAQTEDARRRWNDRPILNVYLAAIPEDAVGIILHSEERMRELRSTKNEALRKARTYDWAVLEYALSRSFGCDPEKIRFRKNRFGKWSCDGYFFSLAHTEGAVAVAVSNGPVGIDLEDEEIFLEKYGAQEEKLLRKLGASAENTDFLPLWLKKESNFKAYGSGTFRPARVDPAGAQLFRCEELPRLRCALSGDRIDSARFYLYGNGTARMVRAAREE